jgi:signal transduction histidine kinase
LVGLRERVELIGGALTIESAPGAGTIVRVTWQMAELLIGARARHHG